MPKHHLAATLAVIAILMSWPVHAGEKTVVLDLKNADCVRCPPIVAARERCQGCPNQPSQPDGEFHGYHHV
jgi:hypothetical protein